MHPDRAAYAPMTEHMTHRNKVELLPPVQDRLGNIFIAGQAVDKALGVDKSVGIEAFQALTPAFAPVTTAPIEIAHTSTPDKAGAYFMVQELGKKGQKAAYDGLPYQGEDAKVQPDQPSLFDRLFRLGNRHEAGQVNAAATGNIATQSEVVGPSGVAVTEEMLYDDMLSRRAAEAASMAAQVSQQVAPVPDAQPVPPAASEQQTTDRSPDQLAMGQAARDEIDAILGNASEPPAPLPMDTPVYFKSEVELAG